MAGKTRGSFACGAPASAMTAVGLFIVGSALELDASPAKAYATPQEYDIPGGPMTDALNRLADMSGAQLAYDAALTRHIKSHGVSGKRTLSEALDELLAGTDLGYKYDPTGEFVAIMLAQNDTTRSDAGAEALPAIDIGAARPGTGGASNGKPGLTSQNSYVVPNASTATKTDTSVMTTPINVQTITQKALEDQQAITFQDALQNVSGVAINQFNGGQDRTSGFFVRGFNTTEYYQDGTRVSGQVPGGTSLDILGSKQFANVDSVELLKGPAAILYGLSEPGGVINVTTRNPQDTPHYAIQQQIGALALYRTSLAATGPVTADKSVLYRIDMSYENNGAPFGYFVDHAHSRNFFVAPVVKWQIDNDSWVKAEVNYSNNLSSTYSPYAPMINGFFAPVPRSNNYSGRGEILLPTVFAALTGEHKFDEDWSIRSRVTFTSTSTNGVIPTVLTTSAGPNPLITLIATSARSNLTAWQTNQDLVGHFDVLGARNTLLLGGDYSRFTSATIVQLATPWSWSQISLLDPVYPGISAPFPFFPTTHQESYNRQDMAGLYVQDQVELPYGFHVMAGARYQYVFNWNTVANRVGSFVSGPQSNSAIPAHQARVTPRFGLLWRPEPWVSLYGNYTQGFSANTGTVYPNTFAPPTDAESWEAGAKFELFDGRLRANIDYYNLVKTNLPISDTDPTHLCNGTRSCILLIGKARSSGPEIDIQGELAPGWNVIVNYTNQDVRVVEGNATANSGSGFAGLTPGQRIPHVPRNLARLWTTYEFQDALLKGLKIGGGYTYHGSQPVQDGTGGRFGLIRLIPSWGTVDLMAAYSFDLDGVKTTAQLNATNIFDRAYSTGARLAAAPSSNFNAAAATRTWGAPFNIVGSLKFEF